ncbi:hypothetical protein [Streptomyces sp. NPDC059802]|uniref:hypothetical protein n=1 Tax=Streptomyces sp. NPDC059802 TaxID=3346952 RepID=UPI0036595FC0
MLRNYDAEATILVLEGDSDAHTLKHCLARDVVKLVIANGKKEVIEAVEFSDEQSLSGVLGVVDADFVDLVEERSSSANVFYTDLYDLDAMVFFAGTPIDRCIEAFGKYSDLKEESDGRESLSSEVRESAVAMAAQVGFFRMYSMQGGHHMTLDRFPFETIFSGSDYEVDVRTLKDVLPRKCTGIAICESDVDEWIDRSSNEAIPVARVSQGHDLFKCISYVAKNKWGIAVKAETWEGVARSHWNMRLLSETSLFSQVSAWVQTFGYSVWRADGHTGSDISS